MHEPRIDPAAPARGRLLERLLLDLEIASPDTLALAAGNAAQAGVYLPAIEWLRDMRVAALEQHRPELEQALMRIRDRVVDDLRTAPTSKTVDAEMLRGTISSVKALVAEDVEEFYEQAAAAVEKLVARGADELAALAADLRDGDGRAAAVRLMALDEIQSPG